MACDEGLAQRLREALSPHQGSAEKRMFGGLAFMSRGYMFLGIVGDVLMAKVGPEHYEEELSRPHVREMDFTGKPMTGYVFVDPLALKAMRIYWIGCRGVIGSCNRSRPRNPNDLRYGLPERILTPVTAARARSGGIVILSLLMNLPVPASGQASAVVIPRGRLTLEEARETSGLHFEPTDRALRWLAGDTLLVSHYEVYSSVFAFFVKCSGSGFFKVPVGGGGPWLSVSRSACSTGTSLRHPTAPRYSSSVTPPTPAMARLQ